MNRFFISLFCSAIAVLSISAYAAETSAAEQRMLQLMTELQQAHERGDTARVRTLEAEIRALTPEVKAEQQRRMQATSQTNSLQQRMQQQQQALEQQARSPDYQISLAARKGDLAKVKREHQLGANLNGFRLDPGPPLMEAAMHGHLAVAEYLIENGAQFRLTEKLFTLDALRLAAEAKEDNSAMIRLLVAKGAMAEGDLENIGSIALKNEEAKGRQHIGVTGKQITSGSALMAAIEKDRAVHVKTLLALGASPNDWAFGQSALMVAGKQLNVDIATQLLDAGADPNVKNQAQKTVLALVNEKHETAQNKPRRDAMLALLRARGAQP